MNRAENIFRLVLAAFFAVCAVGSGSQADWPMTALFFAFAVLFAWRSYR